MIRPVVGVLPFSLLLSGCLGGGNIKGDFDCRAPGGTCAPMTSIDAGAVAGIGGLRPMNAPMGGPFNVLPSDRAAPVRQASVSGIQDGSAPPRTSDWVLRVVFPAHIDGDGVFREESAAHAVVENAAWASAMGAQSYQPRSVPALRSSGVVSGVPGSASASTAAEATPTSALASLDEIVAARAAQAHGQPVGGASAVQATPLPPSIRSPTVPVANFVPAAQTTPMPLSAFGPSRAAVPTTLAEAASGLFAPPVKSLDPLNPLSNYDTPDVAAVRSSAAPSAARPSRQSSVAATNPAADSVASNQALPSAPAAASQTQAAAAAPFGSRPVRWNGRTYDVPYKNPQSASAAPVAQPNMTADLNRQSLAKAGESARERKADDSVVKESAGGVAAAVPGTGPVAMAPVVPRPAPTADAQVAAARVRAMAAPILADAADSGRTQARAVAPQGFALPFVPSVPK